LLLSISGFLSWGDIAMGNEWAPRFGGQASPVGLVVRTGDSQGPMAFPSGAQLGFIVAGPWTDVYRIAYEQARIALEASRFQAMLQPSWN
jgi:hypothetical protein